MAGMAPGPRASFNMAGHRQRAILFGGITDQPGKVNQAYIIYGAFVSNQPGLKGGCQTAWQSKPRQDSKTCRLKNRTKGTNTTSRSKFDTCPVFLCRETGCSRRRTTSCIS